MEEVLQVVGPTIGVYSVLILCIILGAITICCLQRYIAILLVYSIPRIMSVQFTALNSYVVGRRNSVQCSVTPGTLGCLKIQSTKTNSMPAAVCCRSPVNQNIGSS